LCLVLNYIFAWLTLRQGSVIPAVVAHTAWNICAQVLSHFDDRWEVEFRLVLAAVIAYTLFRLWPISMQRETVRVDRDTVLEPAV
jgi:membrane protease YdiL (CAAX protease family)